MNANNQSPAVTPARAIEILEAQIVEVQRCSMLEKASKAALALGTAVAILRALEARQSQLIARLQALEVTVGADTDV